MGKFDAALRVVNIIRWFSCGGASLTTGYACIVAFVAPIRPRCAGLSIVCNRLLHGGTLREGGIHQENFNGVNWPIMANHRATRDVRVVMVELWLTGMSDAALRVVI